MRYLLPVLALLIFPACGGSGGDSGDGTNPPGGGTNPPPIPSTTATAVQAAFEDCAIDGLDSFVKFMETLSGTLDPAATTTPFRVLAVDAAGGNLDVEMDLDGDGSFDVNALISIIDVGTGGPPAGIDFNDFAQSADALKGLGAALAGTTGDVEFNLNIPPGIGAFDGMMRAAYADGALTALDAQVTTRSNACEMQVLLQNAGPAAFDGSYPDASVQALLGADIGGQALVLSADLDFDGTSIATATITAAGINPVNLILDLDAQTVVLAP